MRTMHLVYIIHWYILPLIMFDVKPSNQNKSCQFAVISGAFNDTLNCQLPCILTIESDIMFEDCNSLMLLIVNI